MQLLLTPDIWVKNPFTSLQAKEHSNYLLVNEEGEVISLSRKSVAKDDKTIFREIQELIENDTFPCLAAKASLNTRCYRIGVYAGLADENVSHGLAHDLLNFLKESPTLESGFTTFIAAFKTPIPTTEVEFEALLWQQLQLLKDLEAPYFERDPSVSNNPEDKNFGFSFGGKAFFVIGMHAQSSRLARRSPFPMLVFNLHHQFEALRAEGKFEGLRDAIRQRDMELQGSVNPMVKDFGISSEAPQYSGRQVGKNWKCPFH